MPKTLTIPQYFGLYFGEGPPRSHFEAVERANRSRRRRGLPELTGKPPGEDPWEGMPEAMRAIFEAAAAMAQPRMAGP